MIETSLAFQRPSQSQTADFTQWQDAGKTTHARMKGVMRYDMNDRTAGPMPTFGRMVQETTLAGHAYAPGVPGTGAAAQRPDLAYETAAEDEGFSFGDVIDMVNPLQHLPVIGTIYRKMTGDVIKPMSQIIGGAVFGGPIGAVSSTVNAIVKDRTGKDVAENAFSLVDIDMTSPSAKDAAKLTYLEPAENSLAGTTLAVANLSMARDGRHSFAAKNSLLNRWNS